MRTVRHSSLPTSWSVRCILAAFWIAFAAGFPADTAAADPAAPDTVEVSVKSLAGPPAEFADHRLPNADELAIPSNLLTIDRDPSADASSVVYTNFSTISGQGFSLVQVTTAYPAFGPATFTSPSGARYRYDGSTLTCDFGPCGAYEASVLVESFDNSAGGVMVLSVSGGEVTGGTWQLAEEGPQPLPAQAGGSKAAAQLDSSIAFDDNIVVVEPEPDPCLLSAIQEPICPQSPDGPQPLGLVDGVAPVLTIAARSTPDPLTDDADTLGQELGEALGETLGETRHLDLTALRVRVTERTSDRLVQDRTFSVGELAGLARTDAGRSVVELPRLRTGQYGVRLDIEGIVEGVGPIERTAYYFLPILPRSHRLDASVTSRLLDDERLELRLGLERPLADDPSAAHEHVFAYAEVWSDDDRPIAWIGGMTAPEEATDGGLELPMVLDGRWLALAGETGRDLVLRNVRIQDPDTFVPLHQVAEIPVHLDRLPTAALAKLDPSILEADRSLRVGRGDRSIRVADPGPPPANLKTGFDTGILLVHGWCSGLAWPRFDFINGRVGGTEEFEDFSQSRSHDNFAQRIRTQGEACFADAFTVVAHSQGGAAATHLFAHYNSRLDNATAPRRIQSMGTPYGGSTLMDLYLAGGPLGWLIAEIFGFCGPQFDLGTLGSALWKTGIPSSARSDVFYYRTRHTRPGNFWQALQFWRWRCNAASFIIPGTDDGVTSVSQGSFNNARNMGITDGECHTGGMNHPDQRDNGARNDIMDEEGRPDPPAPLTAVCRVVATWNPCCDQNGNGYYSYTVDASGSIPGAFPITGFRWRNGGGSWGPITTNSTYGPLFPGLPGQASNYVISVEARDSSGATSQATCYVP